MAQITHLEVAQRIRNRDGRIAYKTACGLELLGHAGVRKNINKVTCFRCRNGVVKVANVAPRPAAPVEVQMVVENPTNKDEWVAYIRHHNLQVLGQGASRTVYALDANRVIKIDTNLRRDGMFRNQCEGEVLAWREASEEKRAFMATLIDGGKGWVVMERAAYVLDSVKDFDFQRTVTSTLGLAAQKVGFRDLHSGNIGYFASGAFKVIDYGL